MQRHLRLRNRADFRRLRTQGKTRHHGVLVLSFVPNSLDHNRYGFIVSKRLGNAVVRNRVRRRLRTCLSVLEPQTRPGYDILLITRRPILMLQYRELLAIVHQLLQQAGVLELTE